MAEDNFYIINSWMIDELNLSGIELQVFAIIWSLSRGEKQMYIAGNAHLVRMTKKSEPTIIAVLKKLCEKELIKKIPVVVNKVERNYYKAICQGTKEILAPNNKEIYKENNKENKRLSNDNPKVEFPEEFEQFWKLYDYKKGKQKAYAKWNKLSDTDKQKAIDAIPAYKEDCARCKRDMQHAATYLYNHTFEDDFSAKPRRAFYDILESDTDRVRKFKTWMREKFPDIENTCLPLSFEDGKELIERYRTEDVEYVLGEINREFYRYRFKSIAEVAKTKLQDYDEKEDEQ